MDEDFLETEKEILADFYALEKERRIELTKLMPLQILNRLAKRKRKTSRTKRVERNEENSICEIKQD